MDENFKNYLGQLQDLENNEHVMSLKAMRDMNISSISFFPSILEGIDNLIASGKATQDIVDDIKDSFLHISSCRSLYEQLSSCKKSNLYEENILNLLARKKSITLYDVKLYKEELFEALDKNSKQLEIENNVVESNTIHNKPEPSVDIINFNCNHEVADKFLGRKHFLRFKYNIICNNMRMKNLIIKQRPFDHLNRPFVELLSYTIKPTLDTQVFEDSYYNLEFSCLKNKCTPVVRLGIDIYEESTQRLLFTKSFFHEVPLYLR